jgi:hypothetical protein
MGRGWTAVDARCDTRPDRDSLKRGRIGRTFVHPVAAWLLGYNFGHSMLGFGRTCTPNRRDGARGGGGGGGGGRVFSVCFWHAGPLRPLTVGCILNPLNLICEHFLTCGHCARFVMRVQGMRTTRNSRSHPSVSHSSSSSSSTSGTCPFPPRCCAMRAAPARAVTDKKAPLRCGTNAQAAVCWEHMPPKRTSSCKLCL